ncbi:MAG: GNAT family N-acetyltransferase [Clostridia bacterium]|nr:GNAT family N-acetyltransferase [Clostridia bacterium]
MGLIIKQIPKNEYPSFSPVSDQIAELCFDNPTGILLLAETESGCPVGYISGYNTGRVTDVSYIFVRPLFRGRGIANELLEKMMDVSPNPVCIDVIEGHPKEDVLSALVKRFDMEVNFSASNYFVDMEKAVPVHKKVCETRVNRIIDHLFKKGHTLKTFRECGEDIADRLSDLIGAEFEGNTNPRLFKEYDGRYSYCLFRGERPVAYSLIETKGDVAMFHLLSRAQHSYPGAFVVPLAQSFSDLIAAGYKTLTFTVYKNNQKMRALSDFDFINEYVSRIRNYVSYVEKTDGE